MTVVFDDVSIETLTILETCLARRRSVVSLRVHRLRSQLNELKKAHKSSCVEFANLKDSLEELENENFVLLGLLKQI